MTLPFFNLNSESFKKNSELLNDFLFPPTKTLQTVQRAGCAKFEIYKILDFFGSFFALFKTLRWFFWVVVWSNLCAFILQNCQLNGAIHKSRGFRTRFSKLEKLPSFLSHFGSLTTYHSSSHLFIMNLKKKLFYMCFLKLHSSQSYKYIINLLFKL